MADSPVQTCIPSATPSPTSNIVLDGSICTPEDRLVSSKFLYCLTRRDTIGLTLVAAAAFLSVFSVLYFFSRVLNNVIRKMRRSLPINLVKHPMEVYMLSLFSANLVHAIAEAFNTKWLHNGKVYVGQVCWAQGVVSTISSDAIALTTSAIALHTFVTIYWSPGMDSILIPCLVVIGAWLLPSIVIIGIDVSHRDPQEGFMGPSGEWCFIRQAFWHLTIPEQWIWMWLAVMICVCTYIPLAIWSSKHANVNHRRRMTMIMIIYPLVYSIMTIPKTVTRVISFIKSTSTPPAETMSFQAFYDLIGFVDVVVFFKTRRGLLLFDGEPTRQLPLENTQTQIHEEAEKEA